jgi:hypothetical protein
MAQIKFGLLKGKFINPEEQRDVIESALSTDGRTTVPLQVRAHISAPPGSRTRISWELLADGSVIVRRLKTHQG